MANSVIPAEISAGNPMPAQHMRNRMEDKNTLKTKGSLYAGTSNKTQINGADVYQTTAITAPVGTGDDGKALVVDYNNASGGAWKVGQVTANGIADNAVEASKLRSETNDANNAERAVSTNHIQNKAVTSAKLANDASYDANRAVGTDHIKDSAVKTVKIDGKAVTTAKIDDNAVTSSQLGNIITTGSSGVVNGQTVTLSQDNSKGGLKIGLSGTPTNATNATNATTQAQSDNSTKIATTAYVRTAVSNFYGSAALNTGTMSASTNEIYRHGNLVVIKCVINASGNSISGSKTVTIPEYCTSGNTSLKLRPSSAVQVSVVGSRATGTADGIVATVAANSGTIAFSFTAGSGASTLSAIKIYTGYLLP